MVHNKHGMNGSDFNVAVCYGIFNRWKSQVSCVIYTKSIILKSCFNSFISQCIVYKMLGFCC